ncbi:MAG: zinc-dependent alcohol dehydrogenase family protein [Myxococcota bacterium]
MRVMALAGPAPIERRPLVLEERAEPWLGEGQVLVQVEVCGVCRTDLHVVEGDLPARRRGIVPGHEVVGRIARRGPGCTRFSEGARVGIAWLRSTCRACRFCNRGDENLCLAPQFTGWDYDGGYGDLAVVPEAFVYPLPEELSAHELAPLLCAGIIGYRAFRMSGVERGGRLGLFGFGGSAHVTIQVARHLGCEVYVFSRGGGHRELAEELGAAWVGSTFDRPPHGLDGAILFAPAGELVPPALAALDRGATLAIAGIHLSDVPALNYQEHLFQERVVRSVTANTREDGRALLALASEIPIRTHTQSYPLEEANQALLDLKEDRVKGAAVLEVAEVPPPR